MKLFIYFISFILCSHVCSAQYVHQIKADSVRIYGACDTAELILENRTQDTLGFLFNRGKGRTEFRKLQLSTVGSDAIAITGQDTLNLSTILDKFQFPRVTLTDGRAISITDVNAITKSGWYYLPSTSRNAPVGLNSFYRKNVYFYASREGDPQRRTDMVIGSGISWYANGIFPEYITPVHFVFNPAVGAFDSSYWKTNLVTLQAVTDEGNVTTKNIYGSGLQANANQEVSRKLPIGGSLTYNIPYFLNRYWSEHPKDFPTSLSSNIEWVLSGGTFDTYKNTGDDSNEYKYGLLAIRAGIYDRHAATVGQLYNFGGRAGTATKPVALFTQGALLATPMNGAWEFNGVALYFTIGGVRREVQLASNITQLSGLANNAAPTLPVQHKSSDTDPIISSLIAEIEALKKHVNQLESMLTKSNE